MSVDARPSLSILIPTHNRARWLEALLRAIARDPESAAPGVSVIVSDNASSDHTAAMARELSAELDHVAIRVQSQPRNLGMIGNMRWLVEAAEGDYVWLLGDDDEPVGGAIGAIRGLLASLRPAVLHLPHRFETIHASALDSHCPPTVELFDSGRELLLAYHHWTSFISAHVVEREAMLEAIAAAPTENPWAPNIWFGRAGRERRCAVAPLRLVTGGGEIHWRSREIEFRTTALMAAYDEGFGLTVDAADFGRMLDHWYGGTQTREWDHAPFADLCAAVRRFPTSRALRAKLAERARAEGDPEAVAVVAQAVEAAGDGGVVAGHLREAERRFLAGEVAAAIGALRAALAVNPVHAGAWGDLAVALSADGQQALAGDAFDRALALDPDHLGALTNRAWWALAHGLAYQAWHDACRVLACSPEHEQARLVLALVNDPAPA